MLELLKQVEKEAGEKYGLKSITRPGLLRKIFIAEWLGLDLIGNDLYDDGQRCKVIFADKGFMNFQLANIDKRSFDRITRHRKFILCSMSGDFEIDKIFICDDTSLIANKALELLKKHGKSHINLTAKWVRENCKEVKE